MPSHAYLQRDMAIMLRAIGDWAPARQVVIAGHSYDSCRRSIMRMVVGGLVEKSGRGKGTRYRWIKGKPLPVDGRGKHHNKGNHRPTPEQWMRNLRNVAHKGVYRAPMRNIPTLARCWGWGVERP